MNFRKHLTEEETLEFAVKFLPTYTPWIDERTLSRRIGYIDIYETDEELLTIQGKPLGFIWGTDREVGLVFLVGGGNNTIQRITEEETAGLENNRYRVVRKNGRFDFVPYIG